MRTPTELLAIVNKAEQKARQSAFCGARNRFILKETGERNRLIEISIGGPFQGGACRAARGAIYRSRARPFAGALA